jgi:hypothetical protein
MQTKLEQIEQIHESFINGQNRQAIEQAINYGFYDFWEDYSKHLENLYTNVESRYKYLENAILIYSRLKFR